MFVVPKFILDDDGQPGERNDIRIVSLEHKLGIHASPTCVVSFGGQTNASGSKSSAMSQTPVPRNGLIALDGPSAR